MHLPAELEDWHVAAYSCNDQRQHPKVGVAAWTRMKLLQKRNPIHVLLGTGDQVWLHRPTHVHRPPPMPRPAPSCTTTK